MIRQRHRQVPRDVPQCVPLRHWSTIAAVAAVALLFGARLGHAETERCTPIAAVPTTISAPGVYCVTDTLVATAPGNAITIAANNVVLDFQGHVLRGTHGGPTGTSVGVFATERRHITVRNGTIQGFRVAIELTRADDAQPFAGHIVERMRLHNNSRAGIAVVGAANVIRDNLVTRTGGDRTDRQAHIAAIRMNGPGNRALNNDIDEVVIGLTHEDQEVAGILFLFWPDGVAVNNRIGRVSPAISFGVAAGVYRDNISYAPTCASCRRYFGGTDLGNNH